MTAPETAWYRQQGCRVDELVAQSPIVEVTFDEPFHGLNPHPA